MATESGDVERATNDTYATGLSGRVYLVHWISQVELTAARAVVASLAAARKAAGHPLLFVHWPRDGVAPPTSAARSYIIESTPEMLRSCESIHNIQAGSGVGGMAYRAVIRGMITFGGFRGKVFVHESLPAFLGTFRGALGVDSAAVMKKVEELERRT
jgi:hypothetical protein